MNHVIVYSTVTGHSKKIAKYLEKKFDIPAINVKDKPNIRNVELLFVVTGIYGGSSNLDIINYLSKMDRKCMRAVVFITSSVTLTDPNDLLQAVKNNDLTMYEKRLNLPGSFLFVKAFHPSQSDLGKVGEFVKEILSTWKEKENEY